MSSVFVSYSRKDREVVAAIVTALRAAGDQVWVDLEGIAPSTMWMEEIKTAIANADSVIFVISPDSVNSRVCVIELKYAVELSKRIVPVLIRDTPVEAVPAPLPDINWLFVRPDTFDADVARLVETLETDIDRVHLHTRLLVRATEWDNPHDHRHPGHKRWCGVQPGRAPAGLRQLRPHGPDLGVLRHFVKLPAKRDLR
jgi:hypothetical protein